eukprot:scaffold88934_cov26-Tisochrysis_lutea.AAC.1
MQGVAQRVMQHALQKYACYAASFAACHAVHASTWSSTRFWAKARCAQTIIKAHQRHQSDAPNVSAAMHWDHQQDTQ